ncbi:MAG: VOC family protein [Acidobacteria bacterium]|nr:VOC family protein [Acidobacteriota bacterium]
MRRVISLLTMAWMLGAGTAFAQAFPPNDTGVTMGHWHLNTRDIEANKKIFVTLGGESMKAGNFEVVRFPGVVVYLHQNNVPPPTGGTVGSVVNHVGFIVQNVQQSVAKWRANGLEVIPGNNGRTDQAFVETPDKLRIEILEDKNQRFPIQHHHVHFNVPQAQIKEIQAWYAKHFGARPGMRGQNQAADLPGVNLTFSPTDMPTVTTKGRVLDHIGFDVRDLAAFVKKLEAAGVKIDRPFTPNQQGGGLAFAYDPWGTYIELNQRPNPVYVTQ